MNGKIKSLATLLLTTLVAGCGSDAENGGGGDAPGLRFIGEEQVCIDYQVAGLQAGSKTRCYRDWGNAQLEINDLSMSIGPMTQQLRERIITRGAQIIRIDEQTGSGTSTQNPLYDQIAQSMQQSGSDGQDFGARMFQAMGGSQTDETRTIAGESCRVWKLPSLGATHCATDTGLSLATNVTLGVAMQETAVAVRHGDGGSDAQWSTDGIDIKAVQLFNTP